MAGDKEDNGYPRVLDAEGCIYGRSVMEKVVELRKATDEKTGELKQSNEEFRKDLRAVKGALNKASVAFGGSAILLAIDIVLRLLP